MTKYNASLAFLAGVLGGVILTLLLSLARLFELTSLNLVMFLGAMFTQSLTAGTWILGFVIHLLISGLIGMVYGLIFSKVWGPANWWHGLVIAIPHLIIGGLFLLLMPAINPAVPELLPSPGAFAENYGTWAVLLFIVGHLVYGAVVGAVYHGKLVAAGPTPDRVAHV